MRYRLLRLPANSLTRSYSSNELAPSLRKLAREHGMAEKLFRRLDPELARIWDCREHFYVVRLVDLHDIESHDRVMIVVHAKSPALCLIELRRNNRVDELLRLLADPIGHSVRAHSGFLAVIGNCLVDPMGNRKGRLAPIRRYLSTIRLLPILHKLLGGRHRQL